MTTPRDQPSNVATEDALRPPDTAVVTSDTPAGAEPEKDPGKKPAADASKGASNDQDSATGDDSTKPKRTNTENRRFRKLSKRLGAATETNTAQARRITELENTVETLKADKPKAPEPKLKDFDTPQAYAKAYAKWSKAPADKPAGKSPPPPPPPPAASPIEDDDIADFTKRGKEKLGDEFIEATQDNDNAVNSTMGEYMLDHDLGPEIYVHLSNNHKEARKIFDMPAHKAVKALDALATKAEKGELDVGDDGDMHVEDPPDGGKPDNDPKKTPDGSGGKRPGKTKAPEPPGDTKGGSATPAKSPEDESMDEYAARRQAEERKAKGLPPL